jgi:DNA-binding transcriptional MerR regulator
MSVLEQITEMKGQGISDDEIIRQLQEQGTSPKAINDALNQSQIKKAVSNENAKEGEQNFEGLQAPSQQTSQGTYVPKTQEISEQETYYPQQQTQQEESYQGYPPEEGYEYSQTGVDTNTIIEISEQVFFEKIQEIQKKLEGISEFKTLGESKIENISERMKKIETIIDKIQLAILEKVGNYGSNLEGIKKEMSMMQDSFGKIVNSVGEKSEKPRPKISPKKQVAKKDETFSKLKKISRKK